MNIENIKAEAVKAWARKIRHEVVVHAGGTIPWLQSALSEMWQQAYDAGRKNRPDRDEDEDD